MSALKALLDRAAKRPWRIGPWEDRPADLPINVYSDADEVAVVEDAMPEQAALIAIAVNHFEELVQWLDAMTNDDAQKTMDCGTSLQAKEAQNLLARIEAAAKEARP
jgi:hypothetical protein